MADVQRAAPTRIKRVEIAMKVAETRNVNVRFTKPLKAAESAPRMFYERSRTHSTRATKVKIVPTRMR